MRHIRNKRVLFSLFFLTVLIGLPVWSVWQVVDQEWLNQNLIAAIKRNNTQTVLYLLAQGADANAQDQSQSLPDKRPLWRRLFDRIMLRPASYAHSQTALLVALETEPSEYIYFDNPKIWENKILIQALIKRGANLNASNKYGYTPLLLASGKGRHATSILLLTIIEILQKKAEKSHSK